MKLQTSWIFLLTLIAAFLASCDDTIKELGFTIQPEKDGISVGSDTLFLTAKTTKVDKIFAKTKNPVLGEYVDPIYGTVKSDYVGEFYYPEGLAFKSGAVIDSVRLSVAYSSWVGDSLAPMKISAYEVTKTLPKSNYYTDFDINGYYDPNSPIGEAIYSVANSRKVTDTYTDSVEYYMDVNLPNSLGQRILDYQIKNPNTSINTDIFKQLFKGVYVTTTFGTGTVLNVDYTHFFVHYHYTGKSSTGTDSTYVASLGISITPEVTQISRIQNNNDQLLADNSDYTYLKSPAGVITEITFPFSQIADQLESKALSLAKLTIQTIPDISDEKFKLSAPYAVLLINKDSLNGFFENRKMYNNLTTFYTTLDSKYQYNFSNLSAMINYYKQQQANKNEKLKDITYLLVPVALQYTSTTSYYGYSTQTVSSMSHLMKPAAATISKKPENMQLDLIFSKF
jgi:hypothetical protein